MRVLVCLSVIACGDNTGSVRHDARIDGTIEPDDATPDVAVDAPIFGPWGTAMPAFVNGGEAHPTLTADLKEMYFDRNADIYVTTRGTTSEAWATPTKVNELSIGFLDLSPELVSDGLTIYLTVRLPASSTAEDIYVSTRSSRTAAWEMPTKVTELSTNDSEGSPTPTDDELSLVFVGTVPGDTELFESTRNSTSDPWGAPVILTEINSVVGDYSPMLSQDKKTIYFDSIIGGQDDIFYATRSAPGQPFSTPMQMTDLNDAMENEADPWVSPDGHTIFFVSGRGLGPPGIWYATRN